MARPSAPQRQCAHGSGLTAVTLVITQALPNPGHLFPAEALGASATAERAPRIPGVNGCHV